MTANQTSDDPHRSKTTAPSERLVDYLSGRLRNLCLTAGFGARTDEAVAVFRRLVDPWGSAPRGRPSPWKSEISDDNTPVEFSVCMADGRADVRVLFEAQGAEPTLPSYRAAGLALQGRLEKEFGASLDRFRLVADLFLPDPVQGPFAVWNSVVFSPAAPPAFKTYFNAQARGPEQARALVEEALARLGLSRPWSRLADTALRGGAHLDDIKYFALDLLAADRARVKVYVRHHAAAPQDLEKACSAAQGYVPGEALDFARAMRGGDDRMKERAAITCSSFVSGCDDGPVSTTLYVPVCAYGRDDAVVLKRICEYLARTGVDPRPYASLVEGFANRPLEAGVGMQAWFALNRSGEGRRLTVYLATESNRVHAPGTVPAPTLDRPRAPSAEAPSLGRDARSPGDESCNA